MIQDFSGHFWDRVAIGDEAACWPWIAALDGYGYGSTFVPDRLALVGLIRVEKAHRVAWHLSHGPIPEGLQVLHRCDHPACCNPAHLFLGTHADNMADKATKGRSRYPFRRQPSGAPLPRRVPRQTPPSGLPFFFAGVAALLAREEAAARRAA